MAFARPWLLLLLLLVPLWLWLRRRRRTAVPFSDVSLPEAAMIHVFTDISLTGNSAVLVVYFPGHNRPHQLLLLDAAKAWELVFENSDAFNVWAEERYHWIRKSLISVIAGAAIPTAPAPLEAVKN